MNYRRIYQTVVVALVLAGISACGFMESPAEGTKLIAEADDIASQTVSDTMRTIFSAAQYRGDASITVQLNQLKVLTAGYSQAADTAVKMVGIDYGRLLARLQKINDLIGNATALELTQCRVASIGKNPCGRSWTTFAYSSVITDSVLLEWRLGSFDDMQDALNDKYGISSNKCSGTLSRGVELVDNRCEDEL